MGWLGLIVDIVEYRGLKTSAPGVFMIGGDYGFGNRVDVVFGGFGCEASGGGRRLTSVKREGPGRRRRSDSFSRLGSDAFKTFA